MPYCYDYPRPAVTTDVVLITLRERRLQVLLIRRANAPFAGNWALPGGFLDMDETLSNCARRELAEETGITTETVHMEQLHAFGAPQRDPRGRVVSVAYLALACGATLPAVVAASDAAEAAWFELDELPTLAFDHARIVQCGQDRLQTHLHDGSAARHLLPRYFTLSELQHLYEQLQGHALDKRNFRKRVLTRGLVESTGRLRRTGKSRPAREYRMTPLAGVEMSP